jgi:tRNA (guanine10-N2)-dimethyltransferase
MEFVLSKENIELAAAEVLAVVRGKFELEGNILKTKKSVRGLDKRLGLTKEINGVKISKKEFLARRSHLLPAGHPTSLHPKLARALVNLTGAKKGEVILDPFCGAGGLLIEAGLIGMKVVGFDIDRIMLKRAKINLDYLRIKNYRLELKDATTISKHYGYIVTDLPYGKNSKLSEKDLEKLYFYFFKVLKKIKPKKSIIGLPDFIDYKKIIKKSGLKIKKEFDWYLHKSLTKKIILL